MAQTYEMSIQGRLNGVDIINPTLYSKIELYFNNPEAYEDYSEDVYNNINTPINYYWWKGSTYRLVITPHDGYKFMGVCHDGAYTDELSGTVDGNKYIRLELRSIHTVSYDANGGINAPIDQTKTWGDDLFITSTTPTRLGYDFLYWNTKADGSGATYYPSDQYINDQTGGVVTLYAIWKLSTYTIIFDGNGGTTIVDSLEIKYKTTQNNDIGQYIPQRQAYEFLGWYSSPTGGVQVYDGNGLCTNDGTYWLNDVCVHTEDYTLYAQWKALNIAYYKHEGEWKLCRTYVKVNNTWEPAIMYIKSNNQFIR